MGSSDASSCNCCGGSFLETLAGDGNCRLVFLAIDGGPVPGNVASRWEGTVRHGEKIEAPAQVAGEGGAVSAGLARPIRAVACDFGAPHETPRVSVRPEEVDGSSRPMPHTRILCKGLARRQQKHEQNRALSIPSHVPACLGDVQRHAVVTCGDAVCSLGCRRTCCTHASCDMHPTCGNTRE